MDDYIAPLLPNRTIPVSRGCDRMIPIRRRDPDTNTPMDWGAAVFILIDIDKNAPLRIDAAVTTSLAVIRIESDVCDQCKTGTTWRIGMSEAGPPLETPVLVGVFERNDGK